MAARPANPALAIDILRVTADLIEEKGPDSLTMREVAERLGYSATTIYLYYKDKDELLDAAIDRAFEWFADTQEQAEKAASGVDVLRARSRSYAQWGVEHPNLYRAMFERPQTHSAERSHLRRRSYHAYVDALRRLMDSGELRRTEDIDRIVNLSWATNHGLVSLIISGRMFGPIGETIAPDEARNRILALVDASFDQWMCAWGASEESS
jgi:AcrR family transcriptional regulator